VFVDPMPLAGFANPTMGDFGTMSASGRSMNSRLREVYREVMQTR
jgi:hypothetical protein